MPEWYKLDDDTLRQVFVDGVIVLDANILLQLYRLGEGQRSEVLNFLSQETVKSRVWVPHQVAHEFQRNRLTKAREQISSFREVAETVTSAKKKLADTVRQSIKDKSVSKELTDKFDSLFDEGSRLVESLRLTHVIDYDVIVANDPIREAIDELLSGAIDSGPAPSVEELKERTTEAIKNRFPKKIPPGYCDAMGPDKKDDPEGDYLIWAEIKARVEKNPSHVLLVTNDMKEDWYLIDDKKGKNRIIGPRPELRREFSECVKTDDYQYHQESLEGFLRLARTYLSADIDETTLDTVRSLNEQNVKKYALLSKLRHPSLSSLYETAFERYPTGSSAYQHVRRALDMVEGIGEFDEVSAEAALKILQLLSEGDLRRDEDTFNRAFREGSRAAKSRKMREIMAATEMSRFDELRMRELDEVRYLAAKRLEEDQRLEDERRLAE
ncbi:PIN-like domain-containing protein [Rhodococcus sp. no. 34]